MICVIVVAFGVVYVLCTDLFPNHNQVGTFVLLLVGGVTSGHQCGIKDGGRISL